MRLHAAALFAALLCAPVALGADAPEAPPSGQIDCISAKIKKVIAGASWIMRGCNDGRSLLFVLDENKPEKLVYLSLRHGEAGYQLIGGGRVDRPEARAAAAWLGTLKVPEIETLHAETQVGKKR